MILLYILYSHQLQPTNKKTPSTEHKWWRIRDLTPAKEALHYRIFLSRTKPKQWCCFRWFISNSWTETTSDPCREGERMARNPQKLGQILHLPVFKNLSGWLFAQHLGVAFVRCDLRFLDPLFQLVGKDTSQLHLRGYTAHAHTYVYDKNIRLHVYTHTHFALKIPHTHIYLYIHVVVIKFCLTCLMDEMVISPVPKWHTRASRQLNFWRP